jgi:UDP-glucose 4-epimerase
MPSSYQRYLVSGGAGFIGRRVVDALLAEGCAEVMVVDNLSAGLPMPGRRPRLQTRVLDIRDAERLEAAFQDFAPDTVIHLAAVHHIPTCETQRALALDVNVVGTETILEAAARARSARFVLASSGAVYDWNDGPLDEATTPLRPSDNYSVAKHANEQQTRLWADRTGGAAIVARLFNTIGPGDPNAHLIPDIVAQIPEAARTAEISLGNLSPRRDYIHVDDAARAIADLANRPRTPGVEVFNVATGAEVSVAELVEALAIVMGVQILVREDPTRKRRVDRPSQLGDIGKIRQALGFEPRVHLRQALADIVRAVAPLRHRAANPPAPRPRRIAAINP